MSIDVNEENNSHQKGERATYSIGHVLTRPALLLLLAWNDHAASALSPTLIKQLAIRLGYQKALHSHSAKSPKDGDISRWLTIAKYTRKGYAALLRCNGERVALAALPQFHVRGEAAILE